MCTSYGFFLFTEIPDGVEKCDGNDRPGSPTEGVLNSNKKRKRTCFTDDQLVEFEALYKASCYPDRQKLADLGLSVNLPESRIRVSKSAFRRINPHPCK